jgi:prepilin-type N-terminal cleavage/methylation domain-containing protein
MLRTQAPGFDPTPAFTLVELLVVMAIIVVLIALLAPALEKAVYEAEMVVCAANLDGLTITVTQYAMDSKRWFPKRNAINRVPSDHPRTLQDVANAQPVDDRKALAGYARWDQFIDPLVNAIDVSPEGADEDSIIWADYDLWWDWRYTHGRDGGQGSKKLGQYWEWDGHRYSTLVSDSDNQITVAYNLSQTSHPAKAPRLQWLRVLQDQGQNQFQGQEQAAGPLGLKVTQSDWMLGGDWRRGPIDKSFGHQDGSVVRYNNIPHTVEIPDDYSGIVRVPDRRDKWVDILHHAYRHVPNN